MRNQTKPLPTTTKKKLTAHAKAVNKLIQRTNKVPVKGFHRRLAGSVGTRRGAYEKKEVHKEEVSTKEFGMNFFIECAHSRIIKHRTLKEYLNNKRSPVLAPAEERLFPEAPGGPLPEPDLSDLLFSSVNACKYQAGRY